MREWARSSYAGEDALAALKEGRPYTFAVCDETACYELTAGLPLVLPTTFRVYRRVRTVALAVLGLRQGASLPESAAVRGTWR